MSTVFGHVFEGAGWREGGNMHVNLDLANSPAGELSLLEYVISLCYKFSPGLAIMAGNLYKQDIMNFLATGICIYFGFSLLMEDDMIVCTFERTHYHL